MCQSEGDTAGARNAFEHALHLNPDLSAGTILVAWWLIAVATGPDVYNPFQIFVSSIFGQRKHPIFGEWRNHTGTDYAAAEGTPHNDSQ